MIHLRIDLVHFGHLQGLHVNEFKVKRLQVAEPRPCPQRLGGCRTRSAAHVADTICSRPLARRLRRCATDAWAPSSPQLRHIASSKAAAVTGAPAGCSSTTRYVVSAVTIASARPPCWTTW